MIAIKSIPEQLTDIYLNQENWHNKKLSYEQSVSYFDKLLDKKNILIYEVNDEVLGYVEFWRISFEQFGRLVCHERFCADIENTTDGNICYVANTWIHPDYRNGIIYKMLKRRFFVTNYKCDYFVGEALRKKTQPIKVFKKNDLVSRLFKEGY